MRSLQRLLSLMKSPGVVLWLLQAPFQRGLCVTQALFNSAKQLVRTTNILIDSSEVNESKLLTLFTSFAELKARWMLREGTGNQ